MKFVGRTISRVTTEHGIYIAIAVVSFLASLVQLFIDVNSKISIKWLLAATCISLIIIALLVRSIAAAGEHQPSSEEIRIIKFIADKRVLLIRTSFELPVHSVLSIFIRNDGYEELYGIGYVENVQQKRVASLRIIQEFIPLPKGVDLGTAATIKTTLPYRVFQEGNL